MIYFPSLLNFTIYISEQLNDYVANAPYQYINININNNILLYKIDNNIENILF